MATTNASCKLHRRSNACDEQIIGSKRKLCNDTTEPSTNYMINDRSNRQAREPMQQGHRRHKHTTNEHCNNKDIISSKRQRRRRRHKEELAYKAATIQQALDDNDTGGRQSPHDISMNNRHDKHALQSVMLI